MANGTWKIARGKGSAQLPLGHRCGPGRRAGSGGQGAVLAVRPRARRLHRLDARRCSKRSARRSTACRAGSAASARSSPSIRRTCASRKKMRACANGRAPRCCWSERVKRYQLLLNAVPDPALSSVTARVIGRATRPFLETMILDAGKANGVKPGQAVVDARGMIGRIFLVGRAHLLGHPADRSEQPHSRYASSRATSQAIMAGDNTPAPMLETVSEPDKLKAGDQVVTSGDGGLLPPGLPVGVLVKDADGSSAWRCSPIPRAARMCASSISRRRERSRRRRPSTICRRPRCRRRKRRCRKKPGRLHRNLSGADQAGSFCRGDPHRRQAGARPGGAAPAVPLRLRAPPPASDTPSLLGGAGQGGAL